MNNIKNNEVFNYSVIFKGLKNNIAKSTIKTIDNNDILLFLKQIKNSLSDIIPEHKQRINDILDDIIQKFNICEDSNVKQVIVKQLQQCSKTSLPEDRYNILVKSNAILDAVNAADKKYCVYKVPNNDMHDKEAYFDSNASYVNWLLLKKHKKVDNKAFEGYAQYSEMSDFIAKNVETDRDFSKYIWEKYYLAQQKGEYGKNNWLIKKLKVIENKFGTLILIDSVDTGTRKALDFIRKEFEMHMKAGKSQARFIPHIHISKYEPIFVESNTAGVYNYDNNFIALNGNSGVCKLRHEAEHFLDTGVQEQHKNLSLRQLIQYIKQKKIIKLENLEMKKAGQSEHNIEYSMTDDLERNAVFVQGNMKKYTEAFKQKMIKRGVPEFMTRLPLHSERNYLCKLLQLTYKNDKETSKMIKHILANFKGNVPEILLENMIEDKNFIKIVNNVLMNSKTPVKDINIFVVKVYFYDRFIKIKEKLFSFIGRKNINS